MDSVALMDRTDTKFIFTFKNLPLFLEHIKNDYRILDVEVQDLKNGADSVEERARNDIGMIKKDETFFMIPAKKKTAK